MANLPGRMAAEAGYISFFRFGRVAARADKTKRPRTKSGGAYQASTSHLGGHGYRASLFSSASLGVVVAAIVPSLRIASAMGAVDIVDHVQMHLHHGLHLRGEILDVGIVAILGVTAHQDKRLIVGVDLLRDIAAFKVLVLRTLGFF